MKSLSILKTGLGRIRRFSVKALLSSEAFARNFESTARCAKCFKNDKNQDMFK